MTASHDMDLVLREWLEATAPDSAPAGLHEVAMDRVGRSRRRPGWLERVQLRLAGHASRPAMRLAYLALLVAAVAAASLWWSLLSGTSGPTPAPTATPLRQSSITSFVRRFEYSVPADSALKLSRGTRGGEIMAWVEGPDMAPRPNDVQRAGGQEAADGNLRGVVIASTTRPWVHACGGGRVAIRATAAEFVADLRDVAGIGFSDGTPTTLDGRPAMLYALDPRISRCDGDVHVNGPIQGLSHDFVLLTMPSRFVVLDVDGRTVFVQIWARTEEDLAAFLPVATRFVDSIRFTGDR